jgi:hypothetical protein
MKIAPPINKTAEEQLLGACIQDPKALDGIIDIIEPSAFYTPAHAVVFSATCRVAMEGKLTQAAVIEALRESGELAEIGGEKLIAKLVEAACPTDEVPHLANIVYDLNRKRETVQAARRLAQAAMNGEDDAGPFEDLVNIRTNVKTNDSWTPLTELVVGVIAGTHTRTEPTILRREDGCALLYESRLNWLAGPPESQKSYLAALACIQEMEQGRKVIYIDFEEADGVTIAERVVAIAMGGGFNTSDILDWVAGPAREDGSRDQSQRMLWYTNARTLNSKLRGKVVTQIKQGARFVVLDGCAAAMGAAELEEDKARDVNLWLSGAVWPLVRAGAGVLVIDHIPKNSGPQAGGFAVRSPRGSGAKLAAVSGAALMADPKKPGSAFSEGEVEVGVSKDRPGRIRTLLRGSKRVAGMLRSTPLTVEGIEATRLRIVNPEEDQEQTKEDRDTKWRCIAADRISSVLESAGGPMSKTEVKDALRARAEERGTTGLRAETVVGGFELLISGGWITMEKEGKEQKLTMVRLYKEEYGVATTDETPEDPF